VFTIGFVISEGRVHSFLDEATRLCEGSLLCENSAYFRDSAVKLQRIAESPQDAEFAKVRRIRSDFGGLQRVEFNSTGN
jgi:hypothetical protein